MDKPNPLSALSDEHAALLARLLHECSAPGYYGELTLNFQNGKLTYCRATRVEKPQAVRS